MKPIKELVAEKLSDIKKILFNEDEPTPEPTPEDEVKMEQATLEDGTVVTWEGELKEGASLYVVTAEGEQIPAPDAAHVLSDGTIVTTEGGIVTNVENAAEEVVEEPMAAPDPLAALAAELRAEIQAALMSKQTKIEKLEKANQSLFSVLEDMASLITPTKEEGDKFNKVGQKHSTLLNTLKLNKKISSL